MGNLPLHTTKNDQKNIFKLRKTTEECILSIRAKKKLFNLVSGCRIQWVYVQKPRSLVDNFSFKISKCTVCKKVKIETHPSLYIC